MFKIILNEQTMQPEIKGDVEFKIEPLYYDGNRALRRVSFLWDVEAPQHLKADYSEFNEKIAEKLKQDFLKFISQKPFPS